MTLAEHGVDSVNTATEWAGLHATPPDPATGKQPRHGIVPSSIVSIARGRREGRDQVHEDGTPYRDPEGVAFELADRIAIALNRPGLWFDEWAEWYPKPEAPTGPMVQHEDGRIMLLVGPVGETAWACIDHGREIVVSARKLCVATWRAVA
jgi:hypothetical protein